MIQYILKRLLLMVPTFLLITVLVFVIINLAPGQPGTGSGGAGGSEQADQSANAREGYRLFKEQYNLDKPIVLNFRFLLSREQVMEPLEVIARNMSASVTGESEALHVGRVAGQVISDIANVEYRAIESQLSAEDISDSERDRLRIELQNRVLVQIDQIRPPRPPQGRVYRSEERVENWGEVIVPHLLAIASAYVHVYPAGSDPFHDGFGVFEPDLSCAFVDGQRGDLCQVRNQDVYVNPTLTAKVRFLAVQRLSVNARRQVVVRPGERASPEQAALNREIVRENGYLTRLVYPITATDAEIAEVVEAWHAWFAENDERFGVGFGRSVRMLFLDTRFANYWGNLARLDLGSSIRYRRPVLDVIGDHWHYSVFLSVLSLFFAYFISIPLGVLAAVKQNQFADRGIGLLLFVMYSLPSFFAATLLQTYMTPASAGQIDWIPEAIQIFPVSGFAGVDKLDVTAWEYVKNVMWHMVLPVFCLTYASLAVLSRYARTGLLDVIRSDYIRTARAKGLSEWVVILKHAVRNGMIPILTLLGTTLPVLIGGSIIIEYIFVIDGMGKLMLTAINFRDYNVIMGVLLISAVLTLIGILISDISYALVDPRISFD